MKHLLILLALLITSCAYVGDDACLGECETKQESEAGNGQIGLREIAVYGSNDDFIGHALGYKLDYIDVYIPAYRQYVTVHPVSGEYLRLPKTQYDEIYFLGNNCTGTGVMINFSGKVGSTYIHTKNQKTYLLDSTQYLDDVTALSKLVAGKAPEDSCVNISTTISSYAAMLVEAEGETYDLAPYAPFNLVVE